jgi:cobalt-zinc-cadmium efflux system outer membrane protein
MKVILVCLILLVCVGMAKGDDPLAQLAAILPQEHSEHRSNAPRMTLEELEQAALENNPAIRVTVRRVSLAESRANGAGALDDPSLQYWSWQVPLRKPWDLNQSQQYLRISQNFPGPGKRALRSHVAGEEIDVAKAELEVQKREVLAKVRNAYYALLRNDDEFRLHEQHVALIRQGLESARIKYTVGRVPQQDVLKAQIAFTRLVKHVITFHEEGQLARVTLKALIGRDPSAPLEVTGEYVLPTGLPSLLELEHIALDSRPELAAVAATIRQSETKTKLAEKAYTPDFSITAGYQLNPTGSAFRNTYATDLTVTLPWLNRRKHDSEIAEANAEVEVGKSELDNQRTMVFQEIQEALIRAESARRRAELYKNTLRPQAQATLKATVAAYETDRADYLNLLDSQDTVLGVEFSYYRALADFDQRLSELELAVGSAVSHGAEAAKNQNEAKQ